MVITYRDGKAGRHSVQVVGMVAHGHDLGDDGLTGPLHAKYFCQFAQVVSSCFTDGEHGVAEPLHAQIAQLLVEEADAELAGQQRNVFNDGQTHAPLLVFSELNNSWEERL